MMYEIVSRRIAEKLDWRGPYEYVYDGEIPVKEDLYTELPGSVIPAPSLSAVLSDLRSRGIAVWAEPGDGGEWIGRKKEFGGENLEPRIFPDVIAGTWKEAVEGQL